MNNTIHRILIDWKIESNETNPIMYKIYGDVIEIMTVNPNKLIGNNGKLINKYIRILNDYNKKLQVRFRPVDSIIKEDYNEN